MQENRNLNSNNRMIRRQREEERYLKSIIHEQRIYFNKMIKEMKFARDELKDLGFNTKSDLKKYVNANKLYHKFNILNMSDNDFLDYVRYDRSKNEDKYIEMKQEAKKQQIQKTLDKFLNFRKPHDKIIDDYDNFVDSGVFDANKYKTETRFKNVVHHYLLKALNDDKIREPLFTSFLDRVQPKVINILKSSLEQQNNLKFGLRFLVKIIQRNDPNSIKLWIFNTFSHETAHTVFKSSNLNTLVNDAYNRIYRAIDEFTNNGSDWRILYPISLEVDTFKYNPIKLGSYIDLPEKIKNKGACINIQNKNDNECFKWCVLAHFFPAKDHSYRLKNYTSIKDHGINFSGLNYPVKNEDINLFERNNKDISIHVTAISDEGKLYPFRTFSNYDAPKKVYLLMISNNETHHYVLIKSLRALLGRYNGNSHEVCPNCFTTYSTLNALKKHQDIGCLANKPILPILPSPEKAYVEFNAVNKQLKKPFVIYADFESVIVDNKHVGCSYGYQVVSTLDEFKNQTFKMFRGENAIKKFLDEILLEEKWILEVVHRNEEMIMTNDDNKAYQSATKCHICSKDLKGNKVRDHDHLTGKFRGAAHYECNINYNFKNYKIPVLFHNLRGYDSHLIMQDIGKLGMEIDVIANTEEKYITFGISKLQFIDTLQHLPSSLEALTESLIKANDKNMFPNLLQQFPNLTEEQYELIIQKGVYPYKFMDNMNKFDLKHLPDAEHFYNDLKEEEIEDEDYERALKVWKTFNCQNMGDYHDLYLKTDVCLLADVFENWRAICLKFYGLDPAYYFTSPSLSWDALLKKYGKRIDVFNSEQYDMVLMVEEAKRGGICMVTKRFSKANNKYMKSYDKTLPSKYIGYFDANNLYGWSMSQKLPTGDYRFIYEKFTNERIANLKDKETGYLFEVDIEYPEDLHDLHNDYPLAPQNIEGTYSDFMSELMNKVEAKKEKATKLIPNLLNKEKYVVHFRLLQLYIKLGLKVTKVHRVLAFEQEDWMKPYIDFNTEQRKLAKTDFEKDIFKLMNNSVYGKTCENVRNRIGVKLVTSEEKYNKYVRLPTFKSGKVFNDDLMAINNGKPEVKFNKPVIVGVCVLDLSKLLMYDFHYNTMKQKYGDQCKMIYTDTDSLIYEIETEDMYKDLLEIQDKFDCSDYPKNHILHNPVNKKVIGKFKDEECKGVIAEFVSLRPKLYSYIVDDEKDKHIKCKGVSKSFVKHHIRHETLKEVLYAETKEECFKSASFKCIRSEKHQINTITVNKISMNSFDNKRNWTNPEESLAIGHKNLKNK